MIILSVIGFTVMVAIVMGILRLAGRAGRGAWDGVPTSGHIARAQTREARRLTVQDRREQDLIDYARTRVTSPGEHALLDEVERGRARREGTS